LTSSDSTNSISNQNTDDDHSDNQDEKKKIRLSPYLMTFVIIFAIWIVFSGKFDLFHLSLGAVSSLIVSLLSADLLFPQQRIRNTPFLYIGFVRYMPWLIYQVIMANFHVMKLVLNPRMMDLIDPKIIKFNSYLKDEAALVTFANSITLTPGTITVSVSNYRDFTVHALDAFSGNPLPGEMEERVGKIFGEKR